MGVLSSRLAVAQLGTSLAWGRWWAVFAPLGAFSLSFLQLLICFYLSPQVCSLLLFFFSPLSCWGRGIGWLWGYSAAGWGHKATALRGGQPPACRWVHLTWSAAVARMQEHMQQARNQASRNEPSRAWAKGRKPSDKTVGQICMECFKVDCVHKVNFLWLFLSQNTDKPVHPLPQPFYSAVQRAQSASHGRPGADTAQPLPLGSRAATAHCGSLQSSSSLAVAQLFTKTRRRCPIAPTLQVSARQTLFIRRAGQPCLLCRGHLCGNPSAKARTCHCCAPAAALTYSPGPGRDLSLQIQFFIISLKCIFTYYLWFFLAFTPLKFLPVTQTRWGSSSTPGLSPRWKM